LIVSTKRDFVKKCSGLKRPVLCWATSPDCDFLSRYWVVRDMETSMRVQLSGCRMSVSEYGKDHTPYNIREHRLQAKYERWMRELYGDPVRHLGSMFYDDGLVYPEQG
jgi:hypothetical protein